MFAQRIVDARRLGTALMTAMLALGASANGQERVETTAPAGPDARHPTATVTHVEVGQAAEEAEDAAAVLDRVAGVHARRTSFGQSAFATLRGSSSRQVVVEYEGLRLNPPFGAGFDLGGSMLGFDRISVWRGAAATYRGSGALAGALELRTHHAERPSAHLRALGLHGSHQTYAATLDAAVASRDASTRLGVALRQSDGDFAFTDAQGVRGTRVNNGHARQAAFGATELRDGPRWLRAVVFADHGERGTPGLSEFQEEFAQARLEDDHVAAIVAAGAPDIGRAGDWALDGAARVGVQARRYHYRNPRPFLGNAPIERDTRSSTAAAAIDFTAWGPLAVVRVALDARYEDWRAVTEAERTTAGLGASAERQFGQLTVVAAARGELDSERRVAGLPALGARWDVSPRLVAQTNLARSYRAPNLDELYLDLESLRGNPNLRPETAWIADAGLRYASRTTELAVTGFGRLVEDEILFLPVSAYLVEAQNIAGTWAAGAEIEASWRPRPWRVEGAYTHTQARFAETSVAVPLQPAHAGVLRVELQAAPEVRLWTAARVRGPMTLDTFGNTRDVAHLFWDAGMALGPRFARLGLIARNLLDDDRGLDALQQPLPGRTFWATLTLDWAESAP